MKLMRRFSSRRGEKRRAAKLTPPVIVIEDTDMKGDKKIEGEGENYFHTNVSTHYGCHIMAIFPHWL